MADEEENLTLTVITESEDRAALEDIRDTKGNSNKTPAALKHFNNFLAIYCEEKGTPVVEAGDIPYYGLGDIADHQYWWDDLFGKFFHYVTFNAYKYFDKKKGLVGYEAATGYGSAMKSFFERKFRGKPPLTVFTNGWRKLRNTHASLYNDSDQRTGDRSVRPRTASSDDDRKAMASACFWLATRQSAEFHGLNVFLYHLLGRGRETSTLKPEISTPSTPSTPSKISTATNSYASPSNVTRKAPFKSSTSTLIRRQSTMIPTSPSSIVYWFV